MILYWDGKLWVLGRVPRVMAPVSSPQSPAGRRPPVCRAEAPAVGLVRKRPNYGKQGVAEMEKGRAVRRPFALILSVFMVLTALSGVTFEIGRAHV